MMEVKGTYSYGSYEMRMSRKWEAAHRSTPGHGRAARDVVQGL